MSHGRKQEDTTPVTLRITSQFRTRAGMAYELCDREVRVTVIVTETGEADPSKRWQVEAFCTADPTARVDRSGPTRREALLAMGAVWDRDEAGKLPPFDWEGAARALGVVRAL